jgi:hypothetical protein
MKRIRFWLMLSIMCLVSCTPKPIDIAIPSPAVKLVVASQVVPGNIMFVALTKSFSALSQTAQNVSGNNSLNSILVENALVTISYNGRKDTLSMITPGIYGSAHVLAYNYGIYTLNASVPNSALAPINANTAMLPEVKFDSVRPMITISSGDTTISVKYTFTDLPGGNNYYVVSYYVKQAGGSPNIDINTFFSQGSNQLNTIDLFSDKTFSSPVFTYSRQLSGIKPTDTIAIVLANITQQYYSFLSTYLLAGNWFNQLTGQPITYPTNIQGGYGFFNAYNPDYEIFFLKNY